MPLTNFTETMLSDALYGRRSSYFLSNLPGTLYFGLLRSLPNEDGLNGVELGLARVAVANTGSAAAATGTLAYAANPSNNDTLTIGGVVYTYKTVLTGAANEILIGASASASLDNLIAAITGGAGAGTTYGTGTVAHTSVTATAGAGDTMTVTALAYGVGGNSIATTETFTNAGNVFGAATLTGGASSGAFLPTPTVTTGSLTKGVKTNNQQINFPVPGSDLGDALGWGVWDAVSGGNLLFHGLLKQTRTVGKDDAMRFEAGAFQITFLPASGEPDSGLSLFMQRTFLDYLFGRTASYTIPSALYFGFMTAMPGEDEGLAPGTELTIGVNNYSRAVVPNDETRWTPATAGRKTNAAQIVWPVVATANWASIVGVCIYDAATGGNLLAKIPLASARTFIIGDPPRFAAGALSIQVD